MSRLPSYDPQSDLRPLSDDELSELDDELGDLPGDGVLNIEALDGFCTGLLLAPSPLRTLAGEDWMPWVWGESDDRLAPSPFASGKQRKRVVMALLRHVRQLDHVLHQGPDRWEPIFSVAEDEEGQDWVDAQDWCLGFLTAVDLAPDAWSSHPVGEPARVLLTTVQALADDNSPDDPSALAQRDALGRRLPDEILALAQGMHS
ncbi:MAG: UPF0149 family protein [Inhella sp.]|jgi:uncharacterized protein|uniref:UPF0149 family protein n=1 Tax=Inhella sp. TaxID=1921806 RepID=UPI0022C9391F|nr:UPF0149 family protein [Inhella sp.]MCZ8235800.1 UPF0149 family protein [Inhella sp.]